MTVAKCILMCFRYVKKFLMPILEMTFVFHKSKQALTRATLKKLSKTINCTKVCFSSNEPYFVTMVTGRFDSGLTNLTRLVRPYEISWSESSMNQRLAATQPLRVQIPLRNTIWFYRSDFFFLEFAPCIWSFTFLQN